MVIFKCNVLSPGTVLWVFSQQSQGFIVGFKQLAHYHRLENIRLKNWIQLSQHIHRKNYAPNRLNEYNIFTFSSRQTYFNLHIGNPNYIPCPGELMNLKLTSRLTLQKISRYKIWLWVLKIILQRYKSENCFVSLVLCTLWCTIHS